MPLSPTERKIRAGIAVNTSWAHTSDRKARTQPARDAMRRRFELEVDPDGVLPPEERARRAESARKAFYGKLALASAKARRAKAGK
jgi:hypothetical protein